MYVCDHKKEEIWSLVAMGLPDRFSVPIGKGISGGVPYGCKTGDWNYTNDIDPRVHPGQPSLALVHGTADTTVPYREALMLQARADAARAAQRAA